MIEPLLKNCPPQLWSSTLIDLGNYPMNVWLNNEIYFRSQIDEIQQGTIFLEGTYKLKQKEDGSTLKIFYNSFDQPDDLDTVHCVRFTDCSSQLDLRHWEFDHTDFLVYNEVTADDMMGFVAQINQRIQPFRYKQVQQTRIILGYVLIGIILMAFFITLIAVFLSAWLSVFVVLIYFSGLFFIQRRTGRIQAEMDKAVFFNLAFVLYDLNKTILEPQFKLRCKLGHLGQWIEFHSLKRKSILQAQDDQSKSDKEDLLNPDTSTANKAVQKAAKNWRIVPESSNDKKIASIQEENV